MASWDDIIENRARTGKFHGSGRRAEDAYYAFFHEDPVRPFPLIPDLFALVQRLSLIDLRSVALAHPMPKLPGTMAPTSKPPRDVWRSSSDTGG